MKDYSNIKVSITDFKGFETFKWAWKMEWCRLNSVSPSSGFWWDSADAEFEEMRKLQKQKELEDE